MMGGDERDHFDFNYLQLSTSIFLATFSFLLTEPSARMHRHSRLGWLLLSALLLFALSASAADAGPLLPIPARSSIDSADFAEYEPPSPAAFP